jgi:hypothetical protein
MSEHCCNNINESQKGCSCEKHECSGGHEHKEGCCCAEKFLAIADEAWREVLKDKIKAKILAKKGEHMEQLAELIATINSEKWKHKISARLKCDDYKEKLKEFFSSCGENR